MRRGFTNERVLGARNRDNFILDYECLEVRQLASCAADGALGRFPVLHLSYANPGAFARRKFSAGLIKRLQVAVQVCLASRLQLRQRDVDSLRFTQHAQEKIFAERVVPGRGRLELAEPGRCLSNSLNCGIVDRRKLPLQVFVVDFGKLLRHRALEVNGEAVENATTHHHVGRRQRRLQVVAHLLQ